jgi:Flp pilus assembly CpaF family ATPase
MADDQMIPAGQLSPEEIAARTTGQTQPETSSNSQELLHVPEEAPVHASHVREKISFSHPEEHFPEWDKILQSVRAEFVNQTKSGAIEAEQLKTVEEYRRLVYRVLREQGYENSIRKIDTEHLVELLRAYQFGYGKLEDYIRLPDLEELYFNNYNHGFIRRAGGHKEKLPEDIFANNKELEDFIRRQATENNVPITTEIPNVDAEMPGGLRMNSTLPPLAVDGPDLIIRKHSEKGFTIQEMIQSGTITQELAENLAQWFQTGMNIVVCGGTGSGKTTMLNTLGNTFLKPNERVIIIENRKELQIVTEDIKYLQTDENATKVNEDEDVTIRDLIRFTLRKRPQRILIGEVRGPEVYDAMVAWNSGHDGSMCTVHADSAWECVQKLELLCSLSNSASSERATRGLISRSVDIVLYLNEDSSTGKRRVEEVIQVLHKRKHDYNDPQIDGWVQKLYQEDFIQREDPERDDIYLLELFRLEGRGESAELIKTCETVPLRGRRS